MRMMMHESTFIKSTAMILAIKMHFIVRLSSQKVIVDLKRWYQSSATILWFHNQWRIWFSYFQKVFCFVLFDQSEGSHSSSFSSKNKSNHPLLTCSTKTLKHYFHRELHRPLNSRMEACALHNSMYEDAANWKKPSHHAGNKDFSDN